MVERPAKHLDNSDETADLTDKKIESAWVVVAEKEEEEEGGGGGGGGGARRALL